MKKLLLSAAVVLVGALMAFSAQAAWPTKRVTLVFPFAAGSGTDAYIKYLAEKLGKVSGQPVVAENRPGAGGNVGAASVVRSAPDGHTLVASPVGPLVFNDLMFKDPGFKSMEDLIPVT